MTKEEWEISTDPKAMLRTFYATWRRHLPRHSLQVRKYLIATAWKSAHLMPKQATKDGLRGAEKWLTGEIDAEEFRYLCWSAEGAAFFLDYCDKPQDIATIREWVDGIAELQGKSFADSRTLLTRAAYFAESVITFPKKPSEQDINKLDSAFLCPDLAREHLKPTLAS